jgi:hypothetical protein
MEREAYFDKEKPLPDFARGDLVKYVVQGNFIVQYEVLERGALADDDDDEYEFVDEEADEETAGETETADLSAENSAPEAGEAGAKSEDK